MASGRLIDYLGVDVAANRPAAPTLFADTLGLFYATDTGAFSGWDGADWLRLSGGVASVSSTAGVVTLDAAEAEYFTLTLTENVTSWVISNAPPAFTLRVQITQGAGPFTVAKPGTSPGGTFAVSTGSGDIDVLTITSFNGGTTLRSSLALDFS